MLFQPHNSVPDFICHEGIVSRKLLNGGHLQARQMVKVQAMAGR